VLYSRVGTWPCPQTLDKHSSLLRTLELRTEKVFNNVPASFSSLVQCLRETAYSVLTSLYFIINFHLNLAPFQSTKWLHFHFKNLSFSILLANLVYSSFLLIFFFLSKDTIKALIALIKSVFNCGS
jgi:hypothetical protein